MTATTIRVQMAQRKDTAANWTSANPILLSGEIGYETDTKKFKIGNGSTNWNSLAYLPIPDGSGNLTITGNLEIGSTGSLTFEGSTADAFETTLAVTNPTADRTITLPDRSGTVITSGDTGTVTSTMLADGTIVNADISATAEIAVSKLANGTANQIITTDGTDVSWSSNLNLAGNATIQGDLTVNGTTTTIDTQTLLVEDKNIEMGVVATPTDVTADGGGITLRGTTNKTINWIDSTDSWTSSEHIDLASGKSYRINNTEVLSSTTLGSGVTASSLTSVGTLGSLTVSGSATAASFIPTSSTAPTNGVYLPAANSVAISTNGTKRIEIQADGDIDIDNGGVFYDATNNRLAIGTTTPDQTLVVNGGVGINNGGGSGGSPILTITNASGSPLVNATNNASALTFGYNGTEAFRVDSSRRLLVGTSTGRNVADTIQSTLQVEGTSYNSISVVNNTNDIGSPALKFGKSRGTTNGSNTVVQNGDYLGAINFAGANGTNLENIAGSIACIVDATPGVNDMPGRLVFSTTADGASSLTRRMTIKENGNILVGDFDSAGGVSSGSRFYLNPALYLAVDSGTVAFFNRNGNDGTIVSLSQANTEEGTISVAGNTVSYNQFLGSHWAALTDWSRPEIKLGTILETINELTDWKYAAIEVDGKQKKICYNGTAAPGDTVSVEYESETCEGIVELETNPEFNKAVKVKVNDTAASKAVYGVFVGWNNDSSLDGGTWNDMYVGAVGNYVIRMAAGQEPEIGDLVESDGTGCAVVQDDDIIRTKTVAKITSTIPQVIYDDGSFLVTCVLYCG